MKCRFRKSACWPGLYLLLLGCAAPVLTVSAASLQPPVGFTASPQGLEGKSRPCKETPKPHTESLEFPSKYEGSDKARDDFNEKSYAEYKAKSARINTLEKEFSASVEAYLREGSEAAVSCALGHLTAWADAGAMQSRVTDHTGRSVRKWALASVAASYLRLKFAGSQPLAKHADEVLRIEAWLTRLSEIVIEDWSGLPLEKFNNHEYWAAWAVMATAVALDRRDYYDWALSQYRRAATQVDAEGYLPNELARETRALAYHNYSLGPLAMIAAFAEANGTTLLPEGNYALGRLASRVVSGLDDPQAFRDKTGHQQNLSDVKESSKFAWMEPYCAITRCDAAALTRLKQQRPMKTYRLGGNVTDLFKNATAASAGRRPSAATP